jgi:hypothetical protein
VNCELIWFLRCVRHSNQSNARRATGPGADCSRRAYRQLRKQSPWARRPMRRSPTPNPRKVAAQPTARIGRFDGWTLSTFSTSSTVSGVRAPYSFLSRRILTVGVCSVALFGPTRPEHPRSITPKRAQRLDLARTIALFTIVRRPTPIRSARRSTTARRGGSPASSTPRGSRRAPSRSSVTRAHRAVGDRPAAVIEERYSLSVTLPRLVALFERAASGR